MIKFIIPGKPVAKGRPKFSMRGGFASAYTPKKTKDAEKLIKEHAFSYIQSLVWCSTGEYNMPLASPLNVDITFYKKKPKTCKTEMWVQRPDIDNYVKLILDALNGVFWVDDSQIVELSARKVFGEPERTEVEVSEL